ncbi:MAG: MobA-like NTP transferase domain containing protein, partial [Thermodesulfobacteriota bacterium]|nr:MobA-like NTP transferase domain containing protein [Thermodesulfobacteriota bacterium]
DKAAYGVLELEGESVARITEWKYWREYPREQRDALRFCNAGVYGAKRAVLLESLDELAARPHTVEKERDGTWTVIREYFLTDLVEILRGAGRSVGFAVAEEDEVMGVDTPEALARAQNLYARRR